MTSNKEKKSKKVIMISGIILLSIIFIMPSVIYAYIRHSIYRGVTDSELVKHDNAGKAHGYLEKEEQYREEEKDSEAEYEEIEGITNILLIGIDARVLNENSRSDSMVIATIDTNSKKVKFTSLMRDSYVEIKRYGNQKLNAAYAYGGPELLLDTIERNFKVKLDKYIVINFWGFQEVVDLLGGLSVEVKDYEITEVNKYIGEVSEKKSLPLSKAGLQLLDGQQVLAYSRIRQVGSGSYERNKRQREVLSLMAQKLREASLIQYPQLLMKILPYIKTNIEPAAFLNYAYTLSKFNLLSVEQLQMPMTELSEGRMYKGSWVLLMDKEQNAKVLNDFLFKDKLTEVNELNLSGSRQKIKQYLQSEVKTGGVNVSGEENSSEATVITIDDAPLMEEPLESDHGY